jgi:hypothetical protein
MSNVRELKSRAAQMLSNGQKIDWETCVVVGVDKAGYFRMASTTDDIAELLLLFEFAKRDVMNDADPT